MEPALLVYKVIPADDPTTSTARMKENVEGSVDCSLEVLAALLFSFADISLLLYTLIDFEQFLKFQCSV